MKKIIYCKIFTLLFLFVGIDAFSQVSLILSPSADCQIGFNDGNSNSANSNGIAATYFGAFYQPAASPASGLNGGRGLMNFDLNQIPTGAVITSAVLHLYGRGPYGGGAAVSLGNTGNNTCVFQRITNSWIPNTVTWNNQPNSTAINQISFGPSTLSIEDFNIDITSLIIQLQSDPINQYGFMLKLLDESPIKSLAFWSSEAQDITKRPKLEITYNCFSFNPQIISTGSGCEGTTYTLSTIDTYNSYLWSDGSTNSTLSVEISGDYSVTVSNNNGCTASAGIVLEFTPSPIFSLLGNTSICSGSLTSICVDNLDFTYEWSDGSTNECIELGTGTYSITANDLSGCSSSITFDITEITSPNPEITGDLNIPSGTSTILGVNNIYNTYEWSNGSSESSIEVGAGDYSVTVTNDEGCSGFASVTVTEDPNNCNISVNISGSASLCAGSTEIIIADDGFTSYEWNNGETGNSIMVGEPSEFCVTVTDANGCTASNCLDVLASDPINLTITGSASLCSGSTGLLITDDGFTSYLWSGGETGNSIVVGEPSEYCVTVTDANECSASTCLEVLATPPLEVEILSSSNLCNDQSATLSTSASYDTYLWSTGEASESITVTSKGTYSITVTLNGCEATSSITIDSTFINAQIDYVFSNCGFLANVDLTVDDNALFLTYIWSNGSGDQDLFFVEPGFYSVTISDGNGCSRVAEIDIPLAPPIDISLSVTNATCYGQNNGVINTSFEGIIPDSYLWSNGSADVNLSGVGAGDYSLTITDIYGCTYDAGSASVSEPALLSIIASATPTTSCDDICNGAIVLSVSGGTPSYSYDWGTSGSNQNLNSLCEGTYTVLVEDANGCTASTSAIVNDESDCNNNPYITVTPMDSNVCIASDVTINVILHNFPSADPPAIDGYSYQGEQSGHLYYTSNTKKTYDNSNIAATAAGGHLVTISDATENAFVKSFLTQIRYWTGLNDLATEGDYVWTTAEPFSYTNWWSGQPNNSGNEDGIVIRKADGKWNDRKVSNKFYSVLELDANPNVPTYAWSNGETGSSILVNVSTDTDYCVTVSFNGNDYTECSNITVTDCTNPCADFEANAGDDGETCEGIAYQLQASGGTSYSWSPTEGLSASNISNPLATPSITTTYTVTVTNISFENLIVNGNFESGNTDFISDYIYVGTGYGPGGYSGGTGLYPEGKYTVGASANIYHPNFNGLPYEGDSFMIVNGFTNLEKNVWKQTVPVIAGQEYNFSTYVTSINGNSLAQLKFSIDNEVVGSNFSPVLPVGNWTQFNTNWTATTTEDIEIKIVNNNISASGNDFGLDNISFSAVCTGTDEVVVSVCTSPPPGSCNASAVISYNKTTQKDGSPIATNRTDPTKALGEPDGNSSYNFVALGVGGTITLAFDQIVYAQEGPELQIIETTFGNTPCDDYPETAMIEASLTENGPYINIGQVCQDGTIDFNGLIAAAQYFKITDITTAASYPGSGDGYDVDALICYSPNNAARIQDDITTPNDESDTNISVYPNPTKNIVTLRFETTSQSTIQVTNYIGQVVYNEVVDASSATTINRVIDLSNYADGMYMISIDNANGKTTSKIIKD